MTTTIANSALAVCSVASSAFGVVISQVIPDSEGYTWGFVLVSLVSLATLVAREHFALKNRQLDLEHRRRNDLVEVPRAELERLRTVAKPSTEPSEN